MSLRRERALQAPDSAGQNLKKFPRRTFLAGSEWYRQHQRRTSADGGAWFFASHPANVEGDGRFDLQEPAGTCYLSSTKRGAINELVGPDAVRRGWLDAALLEGRVLSILKLPTDTKAANTTAERSTDFRLTNEIATTDRYDITQQWAEAFHDAGFDGVYAQLRFSTGRSRGLSLFGPAGAPEPSWPGDATPQPVRDVVEELGLTVLDPPSSASVRIVRP